MKKYTITLLLVIVAGCFESDKRIMNQAQPENTKIKTKAVKTESLALKIGTQNEDGIFKDGQLLQERGLHLVLRCVSGH